MTHTLHRHGSVESLLDDYLVQLVTSRQVEGSKTSHNHSLSLSIKKAAVQLISKFFKRFPNIETMTEKTLFKLPPAPRFLKKFENKIIGFVVPPLRVFNTKPELVTYLWQLKKIDLGTSVVVSGLFDEVNECLEKINIRPHTVQFSIGTFGRVDRLPDEKTLEITTMCGHHLISPRLVKKLTKDIKDNRTTPERAVELLGKQCICGAFNKARAAKLIEVLARHDQREKPS